jgi:hypothetical protein
MFYLCNNFHLSRELAEEIANNFSDNNKPIIKIESSEELRSHKECNITIEELRDGTSIGSIYFLEFYSASNLIEKLWIDTKNNALFEEIRNYIEDKTDKKLKFDKFLTKEDSGLV